MKKFGALLLLLSTAVALSSCAPGTRGDSANGTSNEPVTLSVFQQGANITDEEFQQYFAAPVSKKYANISLSLVRSGTGSTPEDLLASGSFPDLIYTSDKSIDVFKRLGVAADLNDLIKKQKLDLTRFEPKIIETIKIHGDQGQVLALPFSQNVGVMIYNKDIFDKFGVSYPTDGMNWEQVIDLSRKVTQNVDGVQYIGIDPGNIFTFGLGLSLPYIDPKTNKAAINNDGWQQVYKAFKEIYEIPGYIGPKNKYKYGGGGFYKDKILAMLPQWLNSVLSNVADESAGDLKWDLVSQPNFNDAVGTGREVDAHLLMMSNLSKHKDQAFEVMSVISSDSVQLDMSKSGRISVLSNPEMQSEYAANLSSFKGKNIAGIFKAKPRQTHTPLSEYDHVVSDTINASATDLAAGGTDVNTLLRETEEKANAAIEEAKVD